MRMREDYLDYYLKITVKYQLSLDWSYHSKMVVFRIFNQDYIYNKY